MRVDHDQSDLKPEGEIGRMDAAAGHNSAQKEESPKGGATTEILNFITANGGLWGLSMIFSMKE